MSGRLVAVRALARARLRGLLSLLLLIAVASWIMALRAGSHDPQKIVGGALILLSFAVGPLLVAGTVSEDLTGGAVLLWLQKPVAPVGFYLGRLALALAIAVATTLGLVLIGVAALAAGRTPDPLSLLRLAPFAASCTVLAGLVTFAFSGFGSRRDGTLTFLYLLLAVPAALLVELAGAESSLVRGAAWLVLFPLNEVQLLQQWLVDGSGWPPGGPLLRVMVYALTWLGVGVAATRHSTRRPFG